MGFKVGDRVVAIKNHSQGIFIKGQDFTVTGVFEGYCPHSSTLISIGIPMPFSAVGGACQYCPVTYMYTGEIRFNIDMFRKIEPFKSNALSRSLAASAVEELKEYNPEEQRKTEKV